MIAESLKTFSRAVRRQVKAAAMPAFLLGLTGVFLWQATQGDHGLIMRERRKTQLAQAQKNLETAKIAWVDTSASFSPMLAANRTT